jgi:hypothetical protein
MTAYSVEVFQEVRYLFEHEGTPQEAIALVESGDWDDGDSKVISSRVVVRDSSWTVVADTDAAEAEISHWEEDPQHPVADWQYEVSNDDTRLGYRDWLAHQEEE